MDRLEADHYRAMASEARAAAVRTHNDFLRMQFLQLAATYDELAGKLEQSRDREPVGYLLQAYPRFFKT
jgi:hypothetical protein